MNVNETRLPTGRKATPPAYLSSLPIPYVEIVHKRCLTDYEIARRRFILASAPSSLPCREKELAEILQYIRSCLSQRSGSCLYVSGVPGTGKTATVQEAFRKLSEEQSKGRLPSFRTIEINGLKLTDPKQAYVSLWRAIVQNPELKISNGKALEHLETYFNSASNTIPPRPMIVVLMDELDILMNRSQSVIYNFFEWPCRPNSNMILIAIANTMDLPERLLSNKVASRLGLCRVNFLPYTHPQLLRIISARLQDLNAFEPDAIELCARKVSAVSGDARRALDICRRAVEIADNAYLAALKSAAAVKGGSSRSAHASTPMPPCPSSLVVTMGMIHSAIKEIYVSAGLLSLSQSPFHHRLFLASLLKCLAREAAAGKSTLDASDGDLIGCSEVILGQVFEMVRQLCRVHGLAMPPVSALVRIVASLATSKCVLVENNCAELANRIRLNLNDEDVLRALASSSDLLKKILIP